MIELARQAYPCLRFEVVGSMAALTTADGVLGGVLSRWSKRLGRRVDPYAWSGSACALP
jgi:hypothetical protein